MSQAGDALLKIREMVLNGVFPRGALVSEQALVERLGISRTPIRAALQTLVHEGLFNAPGIGGYEVKSFSVEQALDAILVRANLEGMAARIVAEKGLRKSDSAKFEAYLVEIDAVLDRGTRKLADFHAYGRLNEQLHRLIVQCSENEVLRRCLDMVLALPFAHPSAFVWASSKLPDFQDRLRAGHAQHRQLFAHINAGEADEAEMLARKHATQATRNMRQALTDKRSAGLVPGGSLLEFDDKLSSTAADVTGDMPHSR